MNNVFRFARAYVVLVAVALAGQDQPLTVNLNVVKNGRSTPGPDEIAIRFNDRSIRIPVRSGKFEVPSEVTRVQKVVVRAKVGSSCISLSDIAGMDFTERDWTLVLADKAYANEYMW